MKVSELPDQLLRDTVKNSTSLREVHRNLSIAWNSLASLNSKKRILELGIDYNHFIRKGKHNDLTSVNAALARLGITKKKWLKQDRKVPSKRSRYICQDSKKSDRKKGLLGHDLTIEKVEEMIANGCTYCGEQDIQITLDRKDNTLAHTLDNCRAACIRCNVIRRHMPYNAWVALTPKIREIREKGLFGDWDGSFH